MEAGTAAELAAIHSLCCTNSGIWKQMAKINSREWFVGSPAWPSPQPALWMSQLTHALCLLHNLAQQGRDGAGIC